MPKKITLTMVVKIDVDLDDWQLTYGQEGYADVVADAKGHVPALVDEAVRGRLMQVGNGAALVSVSNVNIRYPYATPSARRAAR